jgi:hypothetical protein
VVQSVVERWLRQPHVARWFVPETTVAAQLETYRARIAGEDRATVAPGPIGNTTGKERPVDVPLGVGWEQPVLGCRVGCWLGALGLTELSQVGAGGPRPLGDGRSRWH